MSYSEIEVGQVELFLCKSTYLKLLKTGTSFLWYEPFSLQLV